MVPEPFADVFAIVMRMVLGRRAKGRMPLKERTRDRDEQGPPSGEVAGHYFFFALLARSVFSFTCCLTTRAMNASGNFLSSGKCKVPLPFL